MFTAIAYWSLLVWVMSVIFAIKGIPSTLLDFSSNHLLPMP
jgi:hypothetical protein